MPRKDFIRDLEEIASTGHSGFSRIYHGEDDGTIVCHISPEGDLTESFQLHLLVSDLSEYPDNHDYFPYAASDEVPYDITVGLERIQPRLQGLRIGEMLTCLCAVLHQMGSPAPEAGSSIADDASDNMDLENDMMDDDFDNLLSADLSGFTNSNDPFGGESLVTDDRPVRKLAQDLKVAKLAGFRVGYLGHAASPIVCVSCRVSRLGLSEEVMEAWRANPRHYLVCLIRYTGQYQSLEEILCKDEIRGHSQTEILVDLCDSYKPTIEHVVAAMARYKTTNNLPEAASESGQPGPDNSKRIICSFISKPLNALMNERFVKILRYRRAFGFSWDGAELFFNDIQGKSANAADPGDPAYTSSREASSSSTAFPAFVLQDHLSECGEGASFPLIAMQFALRHFVRCTEFCLVCHCKTNNAFEALKPYVCSKPLCLFQYMSLGFGPSLEWEILYQPDVVDLLICFTYASAAGNRLIDFPVGLGLLVPFSSAYSRGADGEKVKAKLNFSERELVFEKYDKQVLQTGDWIVITDLNGFQTQLHCEVLETAFWPTIKVGPFINLEEPSANKQPEPPQGFIDARFVIYGVNFDDLALDHRKRVIILLLDTLPSVQEMKGYLDNSPSYSHINLSGWHGRISKAALDVLRWIVASNRSCIIEEGAEMSRAISMKKPGFNFKNLLGMSDFTQFRFAQGAPDKEQRFLTSVVTSSQSSNHPTIFAWHGSSLANWHGILREGLHYKEALNGRAFGDGVYMSPDFYTSQGYCAPGRSWPQSSLKISMAISLNEVVNAPERFRSKSPHLVVTELDWIQPRYLFVRHHPSPLPQGTIIRPSPTPPKKPLKEPPDGYYKQDPNYAAIGPDREAVLIPMTVFSQKRRLALMSSTMQFDPSNSALANIARIARTAAGALDPNLEVPARAVSPVSVDTDNEDLVILTHAEGKDKSPAPAPSVNPQCPQTNFVPGKLIGAELPLLGEPSYATSSATKVLQRELKVALQIQDRTPPHELGWYIDPNLINTVYQWIVELHTFDAELPITADLNKANLTSIVLELRFSKDHPISPPFVRVIRPKFLNFQSGGGGHVTAGGALCMELLTNTGWSAVCSIENVLLQVRMAISSTDPRPARLMNGQNAKTNTVCSYTSKEAIDAYIRACNMHGWEVPKDLVRSMGEFSWSNREV